MLFSRTRIAWVASFFGGTWVAGFFGMCVGSVDFAGHTFHCNATNNQT